MQPLRREDHPELEALFRHYDETLSFVPNSLYTMARRPEILRAFSELITQIWNSGTLPKPLKPLIGIVSSIAAGCRYCQAHEAVDARERGVPDEKIAADLELRTLAGVRRRGARGPTIRPRRLPGPERGDAGALHGAPPATGTTVRSWRYLPSSVCSGSSIDGTTRWRHRSRTGRQRSRRISSAFSGIRASTQADRLLDNGAHWCAPLEPGVMRAA